MEVPRKLLRAAWQGVVAAITLHLVLSGSARAVPRYSALYEQNCLLCHINPDGGGQRSAYAVQALIPRELSAQSISPEEMAAIDPQIGRNLSVGCDLRTIDHVTDKKGVGYDNFLQMEGTVYLTFQLQPRFLAYVAQGIYGNVEVFGTGAVLPFNGYVKIGKFTPPFGWRFDDHTMFVRQKPLLPAVSAASLPGGPPTDLGLNGSPPPSTDVGLEVGAFPGNLDVSLALLNGNAGSNFDNNQQPAVAGRAIYRFHPAGIGAALGGSIWRNSEIFGPRTAGGPFGYLRWRRLVYLAEVDWSTLRISEARRPEFPFSSVTSRTVSQELSWFVVRGLTLTGTCNAFDPDVDRTSGSRTRYGAGLEYMPTPFLVLYTMVDSHRFDEGAFVKGRNYTQVEFQVHLLY